MTRSIKPKKFYGGNLEGFGEPVDGFYGEVSSAGLDLLVIPIIESPVLHLFLG